MKDRKTVWIDGATYEGPADSGQSLWFVFPCGRRRRLAKRQVIAFEQANREPQSICVTRELAQELIAAGLIEGTE